MDLTGFAGTLRGTPNSSSALFSFIIKPECSLEFPLEEEPDTTPALHLLV
jgi:hypothetical protein